VERYQIKGWRRKQRGILKTESKYHGFIILSSSAVVNVYHKKESANWYLDIAMFLIFLQQY